MGSQPKWMTWTGRVISALPVLGLLMSAYFKFQAVPPEAAKGLEAIGWKESQLPGLGILELTCTIIYVIPQTAMLGAILLTGYMGGAIATHVRVGEDVIPHIIIGVLVWLGLFCASRGCGRFCPGGRHHCRPLSPSNKGLLSHASRSHSSASLAAQACGRMDL